MLTRLKEQLIVSLMPHFIFDAIFELYLEHCNLDEDSINSRKWLTRVERSVLQIESFLDAAEQAGWQPRCDPADPRSEQDKRPTDY